MPDLTDAVSGAIGLGPQLPGESGVARRSRFHQCWYRAHVLKLPTWGSTPLPTERPLGSILQHADARAGHNFVHRSAAAAYERRRLEGWGVDPTRCTRYLTSSQALTINLFGPLLAHPQWLVDAFGSILRRDDLLRVDDAALEYAPPKRSDYLGDMTRLDLVIQFGTTSGPEIVVVETKYADRFNSRAVNIDRRAYQQLASSSGLWTDPSTALTSRGMNQLVRCHALASSIATQRKAPLPNFLVVHRRDDMSASRAVKAYEAAVMFPALVHSRALDDLVAVIAGTATSREQRSIARELAIRYCAESESEQLWLDHLKRCTR